MSECICLRGALAAAAVQGRHRLGRIAIGGIDGQRFAIIEARVIGIAIGGIKIAQGIIGGGPGGIGDDGGLRQPDRQFLFAPGMGRLGLPDQISRRIGGNGGFDRRRRLGRMARRGGKSGRRQQDKRQDQGIAQASHGGDFSQIRRRQPCVQ